MLYYRRYSDDISAVLEKEFDANFFFYFLNTRYFNVTFTMEKENDAKLDFWMF